MGRESSDQDRPASGPQIDAERPVGDSAPRGRYWGEPSPEDAQRVLPVSEWYDAEPWRTTETVKPLVRYL